MVWGSRSAAGIMDKNTFADTLQLHLRFSADKLVIKDTLVLCHGNDVKHMFHIVKEWYSMTTPKYLTHHQNHHILI